MATTDGAQQRTSIRAIYFHKLHPIYARRYEPQYVYKTKKIFNAIDINLPLVTPSRYISFNPWLLRASPELGSKKQLVNRPVEFARKFCPGATRRFERGSSTLFERKGLYQKTIDGNKNANLLSVRDAVIELYRLSSKTNPIKFASRVSHLQS